MSTLVGCAGSISTEADSGLSMRSWSFTGGAPCAFTYVGTAAASVNVLLLMYPATGARHEGAGESLSSRQDRKSTRLNSSHANISYAVFCLKKKIKEIFLLQS